MINYDYYIILCFLCCVTAIFIATIMYMKKILNGINNICEKLDANYSQLLQNTESVHSISHDMYYVTLSARNGGNNEH